MDQKNIMQDLSGGLFSERPIKLLTQEEYESIRVSRLKAGKNYKVLTQAELETLQNLKIEFLTLTEDIYDQIESFLSYRTEHHANIIRSKEQDSEYVNRYKKELIYIDIARSYNRPPIITINYILEGSKENFLSGQLNLRLFNWLYNNPRISNVLEMGAEIRRINELKEELKEEENQLLLKDRL